MNGDRKVNPHKYLVLGRRSKSPGPAHFGENNISDEMLPSNLLKSPPSHPSTSPGLLLNKFRRTSSPTLVRDSPKDVSPYLSTSRTTLHDYTNGNSSSVGASYHANGLDDVEHSWRPIALEEELQMRVTDLSSRLRAWQRRAHAYKEQGVTLKEQLHRVRKESADMLHSVQNDHLALMQQVRTELNAANAARIQLERDCNDARIALQQNIEKNKNEHLDWQHRVRKREQEIERLKQSNEELRQQITDISQELESVKSQNKSLQSSNVGIEKELSNPKAKTDNDLNNLGMNNNKMCSCMTSEYKLLYEMSLLKLRAMEKQRRKGQVPLFGMNDKQRELLEAAFEVAKLAGGVPQNVPVELCTPLESLTSSLPLTPKHSLALALGNCYQPLSSYLLGGSLSPKLPSSQHQIAFRSHSDSLSSRCSDLSSSDEYRHRVWSELPSGYRSPLHKQLLKEQHRMRSRSVENHLNRLHSSQDDLSFDMDNVCTSLEGDQSPHIKSKQKRKKKGWISRTHDDISRTDIGRLNSDGEAASRNTVGRLGSDGNEMYRTSIGRVVSESEWSVESGFIGLRSRRNGITSMPMDVAVALRLQDVKKSKDFSHLLHKFQEVKDKGDHVTDHETRFSHALRRLARKKSKDKHKDKE